MADALVVSTSRGGMKRKDFCGEAARVGGPGDAYRNGLSYRCHRRSRSKGRVLFVSGRTWRHHESRPWVSCRRPGPLLRPPIPPTAAHTPRRSFPCGYFARGTRARRVSPPCMVRRFLGSPVRHSRGLMCGPHSHDTTWIPSRAAICNRCPGSSMIINPLSPPPRPTHPSPRLPVVMGPVVRGGVGLAVPSNAPHSGARCAVHGA